MGGEKRLLEEKMFPVEQDTIDWTGGRPGKEKKRGQSV